MSEQHARDLFGQRLPAQRVGVGGVGDVRQGDLEGPPGGSVTQVGLGTRGIRCPDDARIHGRGRGALGVHQACTHAARRVEGAAILLRVHDRTGGAHQEVRDHGVLLGGGQGRKVRIGCHALTHEGGDRSGLSRGLGRAGQSIVVVAGGRGHNRAAGGRDLGLEPQVGGHARGGEVGGVDPLGHGQDRGGGDANLDRSALRGLNRVVEAVAVRGRNGRHRQVEPAIDRPLDGGLAVVPVSEQNAGGLAGEGLEGLDLVLDLHRVTARVIAAQFLEEDRARQVPVVRSEVLGQVLARAVACVDHAVRALGEGVESGAVSLAHASQGAVADQVIPEGEGTHDLLLVDRGHGEGRREGRGEAERAVVRIVRSTVALDVTGGRVDGRALRAEGLVDVGVEGLCVVRESFGLGEGDRDDVGLEDHRVIERGQEVHVARTVARILRHLGDDELRLGCRSGELPAVGGRERCDVRALVVGAAGSVAAFLRGQHVGVPVTVVVGEGDLGAHPDAALAGAQLRGERGHRFLREAQ